MSHPHLPAAEERTAEAQSSDNPQKDAFVGGSPWSRIIRVKDYSETDANLGRGLPCRYEMKSYRK